MTCLVFLTEISSTEVHFNEPLTTESSGLDWLQIMFLLKSDAPPACYPLDKQIHAYSWKENKACLS